MHPSAGDRALLFLGALVFPVVFALALLPVRGGLEPAHVALILTVGVVAVAAVTDRACAVLAAVSAALSFNVIHTVPYWTLRISRGDDVLTALLLLGVGLVVGELAVRARAARTDESELRDDLEQLGTFARRVAAGDPPVLVVVDVSHALAGLLRLRDWRFDVGSSWLAEQPLGRLDVDGAVVLGEGEWDADRLGLPDTEIEIAVMCAGIVVGRYVVCPDTGDRVRLEHRKTAVSLAAQAGAAIVIREA